MAMSRDKPKILVIDDEQTIRDACCQIFGEKGYEVECAANGSEGLKRFLEFKPDIIFIDLKMPGISGMEVLKKVIEERTGAIPIVITGYASIETAVESMKSGAFDFLPKPFTVEELLVITERAWERKKIQDEKERLEREKDMMRQNFISLVSHELRTPLVAVIQYLEVLAGGMVGGIPESQMKIIERMKIRLHEMLNLINRWLKLARIEELNLKDSFEEFSLRKIIEEAIEIINPLAQERKVKIEKEIAPGEMIIFGDPELLKEVFVNLLTNAVKYNRENGSIFVNCWISDKLSVTEITDTGIGISEEDMKRLGEEFYRVKREGVATGSGLGLAIVKKILDLHNGRLVIKSKLNEGSTFSVYLPLTTSHGGPEKRSES
ncbi:MAG: response regulator [candidate division WOR-3 bacterium]